MSVMSIFTLEKEIKDNTLVVKLSGRIGGEASTELYRDVKQLIEAHKNYDFALDFKQLQFIDSSGLGSLVAINSSLMKQGRKLTLLAVPGALMELLRITNLDRVFAIKDSLEDTE
jgi:anti-anti-sigma factor